MKHIKVFLIKSIATFILLYLILTLGFDVRISTILGLTLIIGIVSYILGDLFLLPRTNNVAASISDLILSFIIIWFYLSPLADNGLNVILATSLSAIGIALCEFSFHKYMASSHILDDERIGIGEKRINYQTEASEEITPVNKKNNNE